MSDRAFYKAGWVAVLLLIICFVGCGSSENVTTSSDDDFVVAADLQGREDALKLLFTEAVYNTITEKSRNNEACKESNREALGLSELPNGQWYYTYANLIAGMAKMEEFASEGDENTNKLEIAAFLANIAQETGTGVEVDSVYGGPGCFIQEGGGTARDSCSYGGCLNTPGYDSATLCNEANNYKCPAGDIGWCGRGPHQLSWGANYLSYGEAMGAGSGYRSGPDLLVTSPDIGITGSIWFWGHEEKSSSYPDDIPFKPSAHNVIVGKWTPTEFDITCGRTSANLGIITNIINGGIECGPGASATGLANAEKRVTFFNNIATLMGVTVPSGWAVNCAAQGNFASCPSYMNPASRCGASWADANTKCGTYCTGDSHCSGGEKCFGSLSTTPCE